MQARVSPADSPVIKPYFVSGNLPIISILDYVDRSRSLPYDAWNGQDES